MLRMCLTVCIDIRYNFFTSYIDITHCSASQLPAVMEVVEM